MPDGRWIFLEPFYGGSHRHLADGLVEHLPASIELWSLPARRWKWRMRGAALFFAERWRREPPPACGILTSSLLDAAALRGLLPPEARSLPLLVYFHENQLAYPVRTADARDLHFAWTNIQSALAADRVLWNSAYNRDSFLSALPDCLRRMPDAAPMASEASIRARSEILPVPLDVSGLIASSRTAAPRTGACRIVWNHRWEHDKGPDEFLETLMELSDAGLDFELLLLGQRFSRRPELLARAEAKLGSKIMISDYMTEKNQYIKELSRCDLVVSTARHEFQGLAVLEAAACGAVPLVPDDLGYREIWPAECRYRRAEFKTSLAGRIREVLAWRGLEYRSFCRPFDWQRLLPRWAALLGEFA